MENITSSKSTFCGERKLLHILEDVVQPQASSKDPSDVPDNDEKARREVALYGTDVHNLKGDEWDILILYNGGQVQRCVILVCHN